MTQDQRRTVWAVLVGYYDDPAETGLLDQLSDDFASYQADQNALANEVGASEEAADVVAIGKDCRQLAAAVPGVAANPATWPRGLCVRLNDRLQCFPPTADGALRDSGVDIWPLLETLRAWVLRPAHWRDNPRLAADLIGMADACDACPPLETRTKPYLVARNRFIRCVRESMDRWPPDNDTVTERDGLVLDLLAALKISAPQRL